MKLARHERQELQATNVGLQLLFDNRQARSSATIFLQWCVAKPIVDYFRDNKVRNPMLFVWITNPEGHEVRHIFDLTSPQEVMQFHAPGTHTIRGCIVWGAKIRVVRSFLLGKRNERYFTFQQFLGDHSKKNERGIGLKRFGAAELSIEVPNEFFAPQLSARETWWINLMFPTIADSSCSIRRRRMLAYTFQPPLIAAWIVLKVLWRSVLAFFFGVLIALRVDLRPIFHPFSQSGFDVWMVDMKGNTSWIWKRADGTERAWGEFSFVFTPIIHVLLLLIALWILAGRQFDITLTNLSIAYVATTVGIVLLFSVIGGILAFISNIDKWWEKGLYKLAAWLMPNRWERLLCSTSPTQGLRPIGYTPRLLYQRIVGAHCKPVAT